MRGLESERPVGSFAGCPLFIADIYMRGPEIVVKGAASYMSKVADTALGTIRSLEYTHSKH